RRARIWRLGRIDDSSAREIACAILLAGCRESRQYPAPILGHRAIPRLFRQLFRQSLPMIRAVDDPLDVDPLRPLAFFICVDDPEGRRRAGARFFSSGGAKPMGRLGGSGGVISARSASNICLSWIRVLRLK